MCLIYIIVLIKLDKNVHFANMYANICAKSIEDKIVDLNKKY